MSDALRLDVGSFVRPALGERVSGDAVVTLKGERFVNLAVIDGLGHGHAAGVVASAAREYLTAVLPAADLVHAMQRLHGHLETTIGAAVSLVRVDKATGELRHVGVGNTSVRVLGGLQRKLLTVPGVVGERIRGLREDRARLTSGDVVLAYSDGVRERTLVDECGKLLYLDAASIVRTVVRTCGRDHDDASCIAVKVLE